MSTAARSDSVWFTTKGQVVALIKHGRGILKRKPGEKPLAEQWAEHKKAEKELEGRHAR